MASTAYSREGGSPLDPFVAWVDAYGHVMFARLAEELWAQVPELQTVGSTGIGELRSSIVSHLPGLRAALLGSGAPARLPEPARAFAASMAGQEVPLSAILRAYELGHAAIWNGFTEYLRKKEPAVTRRAEALEAGSIRMFDYMQAMTGRTIAEYNRVRDQVLRDVNSQRSQMVRAALAGATDGRELGELLGYAVDSTHIGYVAWCEGPDRGPELAEAARRALAGAAAQHIAVNADGTTVHGWFSPVDRAVYADLATVQLPRGIGLALGTPRDGIRGFRHTHEEAVLSALISAPPLPQPVRFPDVAVAVLTSQHSELCDRFVDDQLGPLLHHDDRQRLMSTLHEYFATLGSPRRCARRLGVHPNTVSQRLQRIEAVLGRVVDPADLRLRVALELTRWRAVTAVSSGRVGSGPVPRDAN
ncbi:PucR family transcriptional regulator [Aeromicrobium phragmitis]|nr:helix-turn-helix domain-containing protein [Aeromicrobium phragmitis]